MSAVSPTVVQVSTVIGAITGLAQWALQAYAFPAGVPGAVETGVDIIVPALCTGVVAWVTRSRTKAQTAPQPPAERAVVK